MKALSGQVQGTVNVDMNSAPANDLQKVLGDMRHEYEALMAKNKKDLEAWYQAQVSLSHDKFPDDFQDICPILQ